MESDLSKDAHKSSLWVDTGQTSAMVRQAHHKRMGVVESIIHRSS